MTSDDLFESLRRIDEVSGSVAMFDALIESLTAQRRWHAVFDARIVQARVDCGLSPVGSPGDVPPAVRDAFDERSLAACREVGWPLLTEGTVAAAWMYLRAAADPVDVAERLRQLATPLLESLPVADSAEHTLEEILGVALWEGVDPALGIRIMIATQGTCAAITAFEQAVSRLPAARQLAAASELVAHLHDDVLAGLRRDRDRAGLGASTSPSLIDAMADLSIGPHVDVSHLQSVLRLARICTDPATVRKAWELSVYATRLPADLAYPGEPPFVDVGEASRLFFGSQCGIDVDQAVRFFRSSAATADPSDGPLPHDVLVLLLARLGRHAEALHAAVSRPRDAAALPSPLQASAAMPSLIDLAALSGEWELLRQACRDRDDTITFAASLIAERQRQPKNLGPHDSQDVHGGT